MREILFRGKRMDNGEWFDGFYTCVADVHYILSGIFDSLINGIINTRGYKVIPETVCQFTGLYDKNGRKIFEGDIVEGNSEYFTYTHPYGKVVYDGGQYLISFDDVLEDIECLGAWANDVEIIGNIYDNPELLKGGNENG